MAVELRNQHVAGLFHNESSAETALDDLKDAGFSESEISVATAEGHNGAAEEHRGLWDRVRDIFGEQPKTLDRPELERSLERKGVSVGNAHYLNRALQEGDVLIVVHAEGERAEEARDILADAGADIEAGNAAVTAQDRSGPADRSPIADERRIQLLGEVLRVNKERVQTGEVRLRKEVVTEQQDVQVPVSREEIVIERTPVQNRDAGAQHVGTGNQEIRVPLSEERVRVDKKPVVSEELRVGKRQVQDTKQVSDTVRHEELRTENEKEAAEDPLKRKRTA